MPEFHLTQFFLELQDPNIEVLEGGKELKGDRVVKFIHAKRTYEAPLCLCGCQTQKWSLTHTTLQCLSVAGFPMFLHLDKQRFRCPSCGKTSLAKSTDLEDFCSISQAVKLKILELLRQKISMSVIADLLEVSVPTVQRVLDSVSIRPVTQLPEALFFDENHLLRDQMAFVLVDSLTHDILDVVESRHLETLRKFFLGFKRCPAAESQVHHDGHVRPLHDTRQSSLPLGTHCA